MKKVVLVLTVAIFALFACSKEEGNPQIENESADLVWVFNFDAETGSWEVSSSNEQPDNFAETINRGNGNSAHSHGDFPGVEFSGTENNGGAHGTANVRLGPFVFSLETECIMAEGNEAVYGGTIVERSGPPPPPNAPFNIGDHVYFKVFDNGQGSNADPDQFYGGIKFSSDSKCGVYTPDNETVWPETITCCGGIIINLINDVPAPGSIKVNN